MEKLINSALDNNYLFNTIAKYNLNLDKELILKSLIIKYLIITRSSKNINNIIDYFIPKIIRIDLNRSYILFNELINYVYLVNNNNIEEIINNYIIDGYYFHATHESLAEPIINNEPKPWCENKISVIQNIFKNKGKYDVFGLYKPNNNNLFLSSSIKTSTYYGLTSPSWFKHFVSGGFDNNKLYDRTSYYNKDYDGCLKNVIRMCDEYNLNNNEKEKVLDFFETCYGQFGSSNYPSLILLKKDSLNMKKTIPKKKNNINDLEYLKNIFNSNNSSNIIYKEKIKKEDILLIKYKRKERKKTI